MEVKIQSLHFDADKKLLSFIQEKVSKLKNIHDKIVTSEVTLRLDKSDTNQNKITEIRLRVPGNDLFAKKQCSTFEEATDLAVDALKTQIKRYKEKIQG